MLHSVAAPWDRTGLRDDTPKPARETVENALDALEISLTLIADGWDAPSPLVQDVDLPEPLHRARPWVKHLAEAMPTLSDITWARLRTAISTTDPHWRALCRDELTEEQFTLLTRLWIEDYISELMRSTAVWLEHALPRAARADQMARAGELLERYFATAPKSRPYLVSMVTEGVGNRAVEYLRRLETDPRLAPENRLWMERERRSLQGKRSAPLPDFVWLTRGKRLAQVRQVFSLVDWESPEPGYPIELTFEDESALRMYLWGGKLEFRQGRDEHFWEAPQDYGLHFVPDERYMIDRSDEPQVWPTIARELTDVEPYFASPGEHFAGADFYFGDILMAVREVGSGTEKHTIEVGWTTVEPPEPDE